MEVAVVRQLLDFIRDFLDLCQSENWPHNATNKEEIKNAFLTSNHVSECLNRLQSKELLSNFFTALNDDYDIFTKNCISDPAKYVLKKFFNSNCNINVIDMGINMFIEIYSEDKLEKYLTDFMLEAKSQETILRNSSQLLPKYKLDILHSNILLLELHSRQISKEIMIDLLKDCNECTLQVLIVSLTSKELMFRKCVSDLALAFLDVMLQKTVSCKQFWSLFLTSDQDFLLKIYLDHDDIFKVVTNAVLDSGKLVQKQMSAEYFYIDLNYSQIMKVVQNICKNKTLETEFFNLIDERESEVQFWKKIVS